MFYSFSGLDHGLGQSVRAEGAQPGGQFDSKNLQPGRIDQSGGAEHSTEPDQGNAGNRGTPHTGEAVHEQ